MEPLSEEKTNPRALPDPSYLALIKDNCFYEKWFHRDGQVVAPLRDDKKLIKRKIAQRWREGQRAETADFWWDPKEGRTLDEFIRQYNAKKESPPISPSVFRYFNNKFDSAYFFVPFFAGECFRASEVVVARTRTPPASLPADWGPTTRAGSGRCRTSRGRS